MFFRLSTLLKVEIALTVLSVSCFGQVAATTKPIADGRLESWELREEAPADANPLPVDRGAAALWQSLRKLHTRASMLMVTAHPDDEDGATLTYESRGEGARVALLTLNRGESGANVMSPDLFDALGLVRTEELLAADRYYGVDQYWTRVINDGFSKTKEESMSHWTRDRVLADAVRVVRLTRPLVISSVFIGGPSDGHGNHQVAGEMAQEVFRYAGDPKMFPEQIRAGLRPWSPLKEYAEVPRARVTEQGVYDYATHHWAPARAFDYIHEQWQPWPLDANVIVPTGRQDPILGVSYAQLSREGLGFQRSQNGGSSIPASGEMFSKYHRFASLSPAGDKEGSFFDGIDISLMGIASLVKKGDPTFLRQHLLEINEFVEQAMKEFDSRHPEKTAPLLASGLKATTALIAEVSASNLSDDEKYDVNHELRVKEAQFEKALGESFELSIMPTVASNHESDPPIAGFGETPESFLMAIPGQQFAVNVHIDNPNSTPVELEKVELLTREDERWNVTPTEIASSILVNNKPENHRFQVTVPQDASFTRPYFSRTNVEQPYYDIDDQQFLNRPLAPYPLTAWATFRYQNVVFNLGRVVQSVHRITGLGTVMEPLVTGPALSVSVSSSRGILPLTAQSFPIEANIHSNVKGPAKGTVRLELPPGWTSSPASTEFSTDKDGDDRLVLFSVTPSHVREEPYDVTVVAEYNGHQYREGYQTAGYRGLRPYNLYRPSTYRVTGVDVKIAPKLNVGYVMGSGDKVPQALESLGVNLTFLAAPDLASGNLSKYDVILLGVRTYAVRDDLRANNSRLLDYVKDGGVVVVQYNTPEFDKNYGPYPYTMTNDPEEVTDEASKVEILDPDNPVFQWPNKIGAKDFEGWVAERGSKFMSKWDPRYQPLLETHDPEQDPQKGGLLYARYGKGAYVYNAYAFYRQLPEGVPGAFRILANLVSLSKNPQFNSSMRSMNTTKGQ
ncbi:PIG-L family deacetylase [Edaphobacter bradus]|uniref:PIG-L family deacetylase n=1 Tax=Edaphobacter bradus TaxID=2259016 RepID=UPI0021E0B1EB|nr:PIG-L family deacetylase [Edaphobacter bradus]